MDAFGKELRPKARLPHPVKGSRDVERDDNSLYAVIQEVLSVPGKEVK